MSSRLTIERDGAVLLAEGVQAATKHLATLLPTVMASEDAAEGMMSFVERRDAVFSGR